MRIYEFFKPCSIIYVKSWLLMKKTSAFVWSEVNLCFIFAVYY